MLTRLIATVAAMSTLAISGEEVKYSNLEHHFTAAQYQPLETRVAVPRHPVLLASHVETLEAPISDVPPPPVAMGNQSTTAQLSFDPQPVQVIPPSDSIVVVPEGCAELIGPCREYNPWFAGTDLLILSTTFSNSQFTLDDKRGSFSVRPYLGYEDAMGSGIRGRIWGMSHEPELLVYASGLTPTYSTTADLSAGSFDLDFYKRFRFVRSSIAVGGGLRTTTFDIERTIPAGELKQEVDAGGVSVFADVRHVLNYTPVSEWAWVFRTRAGALSGQSEGLLDDELDYRVDSTVFTLEAAFGTEYVRHFQHHDFVANFMAESNYWDMSDLGSATFNGLSIRLGFQW
jgi:hypothetical protein